ncbi:MAG: IS1 family transposase [Methanobrevibacter sp.]|nr:IS1 family transposase [Methanobrevibacter sp.]
MPRKPQQKTIEDAFLGLSVKDAEALLTKYNEKHKKKIRVKKPSTSEMEAKILNAYSPFMCIQCGSTHIVKNGQTPGTRLQKYRCNDCGRSFNILSDTFMDKSTISWDVWV